MLSATPREPKQMHLVGARAQLQPGPDPHLKQWLCGNPRIKDQLNLFRCLATIHQRHTVTQTNNPQDKPNHYLGQLKIERLNINWVLSVSRDGTISVFFVFDDKFLGQLASLFLHVDAKDCPLLRHVPETDVWLVAMKHRDAGTDQLEMSDLIHVDVVETRERWAWPLQGHTEVIDSDAGMQIGHSKHRLAGVQGLCMQYWDGIVDGFPVANNLKWVDVHCHDVTLWYIYMPWQNKPHNCSITTGTAHTNIIIKRKYDFSVLWNSNAVQHFIIMNG